MTRMQILLDSKEVRMLRRGVDDRSRWQAVDDHMDVIGAEVPTSGGRKRHRPSPVVGNDARLPAG